MPEYPQIDHLVVVRDHPHATSDSPVFAKVTKVLRDRIAFGFEREMGVAADAGIPTEERTTWTLVSGMTPVTDFQLPDDESRTEGPFWSGPKGLLASEVGRSVVVWSIPFDQIRSGDFHYQVDAGDSQDIDGDTWGDDAD